MAPRNEEHGTVTPYQFTALVVGAVIGVGVLAYPRLVAARAGTGAPLATGLGMLAAAVLMWLLVRLGQRFPRQTLFEYQEELYGRFLGRLLGVGLCAYMLWFTALTAREFGEVVATTILRRTPLEITTSSMFLLAAYLIRRDLQVIARVFEVFFPLMIFPASVIGFLSLVNARTLHLLPVVGNRGVSGLAMGGVYALMGYIAALVAGILIPNVNLPYRTMPAALAGIAVSGGVYMLVVTASLAVFGPEYVNEMLWPTLELARVTTIPGFLLERLDAAFIAIWVAAVFTTICATYYLAVVGLTQLSRLGDHRALVFPLIPVLHVIAFVPRNLDDFYASVNTAGFVGVLAFAAITLVGTAVAHLRAKGRRADARKP